MDEELGYDTSVESVDNTDVDVATTGEEIPFTDVDETEGVEGEETEESFKGVDGAKSFAKRLSEKTKQIEEKYSPYVSFIENEAKKYGMNTEEYIQAIAEQREQEALEAQQEADIQKYGDLPQEVLEKVKKAEEYEQREQETARWREEGQAFLKEFPNFKNFNEMPEEVFQIVEKEKCSLISAYKSYQYDMQNSEKFRIEQEQKMLSNINKNKVMPNSLSKGSEHKPRNVNDIPKDEFEKMLETVKRGGQINL